MFETKIIRLIYTLNDIGPGNGWKINLPLINMLVVVRRQITLFCFKLKVGRSLNLSVLIARGFV